MALRARPSQQASRLPHGRPRRPTPSSAVDPGVAPLLLDAVEGRDVGAGRRVGEHALGEEDVVELPEELLAAAGRAASLLPSVAAT